MTVAEYPMWVTTRYAELGNQTGFVMVPQHMRAAILADEGALDTFDQSAFPDTSPLGPPITGINAAPGTVTPASPVGTTAATLSIAGGTGPASFVLLNDDGDNFTIAGNLLQTAKTGLSVGAHVVRVRAADAGGQSLQSNVTVTVTAAVGGEETAEDFEPDTL